MARLGYEELVQPSYLKVTDIAEECGYPVGVEVFGKKVAILEKLNTFWIDIFLGCINKADYKRYSEFLEEEFDSSLADIVKIGGERIDTITLKTKSLSEAIAIMESIDYQKIICKAIDEGYVIINDFDKVTIRLTNRLCPNTIAERVIAVKHLDEFGKNFEEVDYIEDYGN